MSVFDISTQFHSEDGNLYPFRERTGNLAELMSKKKKKKKKKKRITKLPQNTLQVPVIMHENMRGKKKKFFFFCPPETGNKKCYVKISKINKAINLIGRSMDDYTKWTCSLRIALWRKINSGFPLVKTLVLYGSWTAKKIKYLGGKNKETNKTFYSFPTI